MTGSNPRGGTENAETRFGPQLVKFAERVMKRIKLARGDIFAFEKSSSEWGCGQILRSNILQYVVVFEPTFRHDSILEAVNAKPLLCGWTMDGRFCSGEIGRAHV